MSNFFDDIYMQIDNSKSYLQYWNKVSGINKKLFNRVCSKQLNLMLKSLNIKNDDFILDIGCGNGELLNLIIDDFAVSGVGIDSSSYGINVANQSRLNDCNFIVGKLEEFSSHFKDKVDVLIAVDSLGRATDFKTLEDSIKVCVSKDFRGGIFHSEEILPQEPKTFLEPDKTEIGNFLKNIGANYKSYDCTQLEFDLWKKSIDVLNSMKEDFIKEGNRELYLDSLDDNLSFLKLFEENRIRRYFYFFDFSKRK